MRPDALSVRALASRATLPPTALAAVFGKGAVLRPSAAVEVVRRGEVLGRVAVAEGAALALASDAVCGTEGRVMLRGPVGAVGPVTAERVRSRLVLPEGLKRAWGVPDRTTVEASGVAVSVAVETGPDPVLELERALWLGAGRPDTARWLPGVDLAPPKEDAPDDGTLEIDRRVVTETDVRQARLKRRRIRLRPGQIVTPAALSLGREAGVFEG